MTAEGDCGKVVRCDRAGSAGDIRLAELKCPNGLAFDLHLQTCDWKANVKASGDGSKNGHSWFRLEKGFLNISSRASMAT